MPVRLPASPRAVRRAGTAAAAALGLLVAAPGASAATSCPDADAAPSAVGVARSAVALGCLVNHERQAVGLPALTTDARAAQAATWHSDDMAARNYFAHDAPLGAPHGTDVGDRLTNAGYTWTLVGENIARGQSTPRTVMAAWLASPGHCANIMRTGFTDAGYGISTAGNGPYWTQVFARPMGVAAPAGPEVSCPRTPASPTPSGTAEEAPVPAASPAPGATAVAPSAPAPSTAGTATTPVGPKAVAVRERRRLTVRVTVPRSAGRTRVVVRVRQGGRVVRTRTVTRAAGTHRLSVALPAARRGTVTARIGARTVSAAFR